MIRTGHPTLQTAYEELTANGYREAFSSPGRPRLWVKGKPGKSQKRVAVQVLDNDERRIVDYPEPAVVNQFDESVERGGDYENC